MKVQIIYLVIFNGVIMSAHNTKELAEKGLQRLLSVFGKDSCEHRIEHCVLSLKGKREIVSADIVFGIKH